MTALETPANVAQTAPETPASGLSPETLGDLDHGLRKGQPGTPPSGDQGGAEPHNRTAGSHWEDVEGTVEPPQPKHSTRGESPGPRGCWALAKHGGGCGAAAIRGEDFCNAHAGRSGVAANPSMYAPLAAKASQEARAARAQMRLQLGITRPTGPRAVLKAKAFLEQEAIAARVVADAKLDGALGLRLINTVDPAPVASLSVDIPADLSQLDGLSMSQLFALGEKLGIDQGDDPLPAEQKVIPSPDGMDTGV